MKDIFFTYRGNYVNDGITYSDGNQSQLLHSEENFEAVIEMMPKGSAGYLESVHENGFEFTYVLKGKMELLIDGEPHIVTSGDTYSHHDLHRNILFRVIEDVELLAINTSPCFDFYEQDNNRLSIILKDLQDVDGDTKQHCIRVTRISMGIAFFLNFDQAELPDLFEASSYHDIGKAKIPPEILLKPGKLTFEEFEIMKLHSQYTYEMVKEYYGDKIAKIAYEHHEKLDGTGYPQQLKGEQISLAARIICVADAYDAMTVTRPYRKGMTKEAALAELYRCSDIQFDRSVVEALEKYLKDCD